MILLLAGPAFLALTFALMLGRVEPFATFFYQFAWYGLIFTFDQLIRRRQGRSLIATCGPGFLALLFWSSVTWYFFELVNLRLQNWYYIFVSDSQSLRFVGSIVAFATVFPGIFWIEHYLALRGVAAQVSGSRTRLTSSISRNRRRMSVVAHSRATAFGITSPKMSMSGVRPSVTTRAAASPATGMSAHVATDEALMWAMVTPIMDVESRRSGSLVASR